MTDTDFAGQIDHTILDKSHSAEEVELERNRANEVNCNLCIPPNRVDEVAGRVKGELMTVVGFPMGYQESEVKRLEVEHAVAAGADSVDVATDVSALKSGDHEGYRRDVEAVVEAAPHVKAILETGLLDSDGIEVAAELCAEAGVDYVKTSTGYFGEGASVEVVERLVDLGLDVEVKASGGVRDPESTEKLLAAGADRIGSSSGVEIVEEHRSG